MLIHELGGEFKLLEHILSSKAHPAVVVNNGDDGAVFRCGNEFLAASVDAFVSGRHFSFDYFTPEQVGAKAIEASASDVVAMGGLPQFVFISIVIPRACEVETIKRLYNGMYSACERVGAVILGGDTTSGTDELVISVSVLGRILDEKHICTRGGAKPGDLVFVSAELGASACGLALIQKGVAGFDSVKKHHLEPHCRVDLASALAAVATSMIDISDGLSSEIHHLARSSQCGALIHQSAIPISTDVKAAAQQLSQDPYVWALDGGEDFELLYTVNPKDRPHAKGVEIGVMTSEPDVRIELDGVVSMLRAKGFNHF